MIDINKVEELREKYIKLFNDFLISLNPYDYDNNVWENVKNMCSIAKEKILLINIDDEKKFEREFYFILDDLKLRIQKENTLKSDVLSSREIFLRNVRDISQKIASGFMYVWTRVKHIFAIPALAFSSFVFAFCIHMMISFVIHWIIPQAYSEAYDGIAESVIACIIYITLRYQLIKDVYLNRPDIDIKKHIVKHAFTILIWWILVFTIRYKEAYAINDLFFAYRMFLLPFLPLSGLSHDFFSHALVMYFIVNIIPIVLSIIFLKKSEKTFDELVKENEKYNDKVEDDSDNFRALL